MNYYADYDDYYYDSAVVAVERKVDVAAAAAFAARPGPEECKGSEE